MRRKKYKQSQFHSDDELLNLLDNSDCEEVIENEDAMEMIYLPLEEYQINSDDDEIIDIKNVINKNYKEMGLPIERSKIMDDENVDSDDLFIDLDNTNKLEK